MSLLSSLLTPALAVIGEVTGDTWHWGTVSFNATVNRAPRLDMKDPMGEWGREVFALIALRSAFGATLPAQQGYLTAPDGRSHRILHVDASPAAPEVVFYLGAAHAAP